MSDASTPVAPAGDYRQWKSWEAQAFFACSERQRTYFDAELAEHDFAGRRVLEIGFGNGELLRWLADRGAELHGFEIDPDLNAAARRAGVSIVDPSQPAGEKRFDFILLFDVLEHLTRPDLIGALASYSRLLAPEGRLIARFPNSQSPLSSVYQHGDATHQGFVSAAILEQLAPAAGLRVTTVRRPRAARSGSIARRAGGAARDLLQRAIEQLLALAYAFDAPLSPNVVVELLSRGEER